MPNQDLAIGLCHTRLHSPCINLSGQYLKEMGCASITAEYGVEWVKDLGL